MEGMRQLIALHPRPDQAKSEEDLPFAPTVSTGPTTTTGGLVALQGVWRLTFAFGNRADRQTGSGVKTLTNKVQQTSPFIVQPQESRKNITQAFRPAHLT